MSQRTIVITGASDGIGAAAARKLAAQGDRLVLIGRRADKLDAVAGPLDAEGLVADFERLADVRTLAQQIRERTDRIDVLANNAGGVFRGSTVDGFNTTMQTNHIAPFLLTQLLLPQLPDGARIVNTASMASATGLDPTPPSRRFPSGWVAYGTSKKANILFTLEAAKRWPHVTSVSFHPGVVRTRFGTPAAQLFYRLAPGLETPEGAAKQLIWLATEPAENLVNGAYYYNYKVVQPRGVATNEAAATRLWEATASLVD